jgi:hypothetical protein
MNKQQEAVASATQRWVRELVIGLGLCPFAAGAMGGGKLRIRVSEAQGAAGLLQDLYDELHHLRHHPEVETSLLVHPDAFASFDAYLDFLPMSEGLLETYGMEEDFQLASFHPQYRFEGEEADSPSHYTNRSPYPMLHLLRVESVAEAIAAYGDTEEIPRRNIARMQELGLDRLRQLWEDCHRTDR